MSYWFSSEAPEPKPTRPRVHVPSHNPCDWTNPIVPKRRPMPAGYVAPGERLRRIAAALDAEWDERQQLKTVSGVMQSAEWHQKTQQKTRNAINKRAQRITAAELATANEELHLVRRAKLQKLYEAERQQHVDELRRRGLAIAGPNIA